MHSRRFFSLLTVTLAVLTPWGVAPASARSSSESVPQLHFRERVLPNGLRVVSLEDHTTPTVAIQVWYHVGSKDDPTGRSGFAHLFEHLMFKSTQDMPSEMMDRLTEDIGGENNAFTQDDVTVYHETVPSNHLERLLWAEADRMGALDVNQANFVSERAVVEEEFRQSILAQPYGPFELLVSANSFAAHPYKRNTIGSIADLEAATLPDVVQFHQTYYRPDNATLVVVGDFEPRQLDGWVDKYLGRVARPTAPLPRVSVVEPPRVAERRLTFTGGTNVPLPDVVVNYLVPSRTDADAPALQIAAAVLSGGRASRLYETLVYTQQIAQSASAYADLREQAGLFTLEARLASGQSPEVGERTLLAQVEALQQTPVSVVELARAKTQILVGTLRSQETDAGRASALGNAAVLLGDVRRVNTDPDRLQAVSAADVQRVARKYFVPTNRVTLDYLPPATDAAPKGENR